MILSQSYGLFFTGNIDTYSYSYHIILYHIISYTRYIDDSIICLYIYKHAPNFDHKPICIPGLPRMLSKSDRSKSNLRNFWVGSPPNVFQVLLVGGFNPSEKY